MFQIDNSEDDNKDHNEKTDILNQDKNPLISNECNSGQTEGHDMCSSPLRCDCDCHHIPPGTTGYHTCNSCGERAPVLKCDYINISMCPWANMACPRCANGLIVHTKD